MDRDGGTGFEIRSADAAEESWICGDCSDDACLGNRREHGDVHGGRKRDGAVVPLWACSANGLYRSGRPGEYWKYFVFELPERAGSNEVDGRSGLLHRGRRRGAGEERVRERVAVTGDAERIQDSWRAAGDGPNFLRRGRAHWRFPWLSPDR